MWWVGAELARRDRGRADPAHARHLSLAAPPAARPAHQRRDPREGADARARPSSRTPSSTTSMTRARREASSRPLSLVSQTFELGQSIVTLIGLGGLLLAFSPIALAILFAAAIPPFISELKFSGDAFRLSRWRTPETREQIYLETVLAREDHAKEVMLFGLGPRFLDRYQAIFDKLYAGDRKIAINRGIWALILGTLGNDRVLRHVPVDRAVDDRRRAHARRDDDVRLRVPQGAERAVERARRRRRHVRGQPVPVEPVRVPRHADDDARRHRDRGPRPGDGVRFEDVSFAYPGSHDIALDHVDLHIPPGIKLAIVGENGSGKTTLIKLLTRLYEPTTGPDLARRARPPRVGPGDAAPPDRRHLPGLRALPAQGRREHRRRRRSRVRRSRALGRRGGARPREAVHRDASRRSSTPSSASGSRTAASSRSASGRRSRSRVRSCARTPTSSCSTSRPRRWTPRPRSRSSSASAS